MSPCDACQGAGTAVVTVYRLDGTTTNHHTRCPRCGGTGTEGEK